MAKKLENFIENYLKNKKISDYEGWLALYGKDSDAAFRAEKAEADTAYAVSRAEQGSLASSLYKKGLSGSGYSDYLNHAAYATRQEALTDAHRKRRETVEENERGYLSYLEKAQKEEEKAQAAKEEEEKAIFTDLLSKKIINEKSAITYLTMRGIDEKKARTLAAQSIKILKGSSQYVNQLISEAEASNMDYYTAYVFALEKGLDQAAAEEAATIAAFRGARKKPTYNHSYNYY